MPPAQEWSPGAALYLFDGGRQMSFPCFTLMDSIGLWSDKENCGQGCQNDDSLVRAMNTAMLSGDEFAARPSLFGVFWCSSCILFIYTQYTHSIHIIYIIYIYIYRYTFILYSTFFNFIWSRSCQLCCAKLGVLMNRKKSGRLSKAQDWQS